MRGTTAIELLGKLRQAIDKAELTLVYQPKFDLRTAEIVGAEALLRWPSPTGVWWARRSSCRWFAGTV